VATREGGEAVEALAAVAPLAGEERDLETVEMEITMGPQHPSTHGVFCMVLTLEGERVKAVEPRIGYLHRALAVSLAVGPETAAGRRPPRSVNGRPLSWCGVFVAAADGGRGVPGQFPKPCARVRLTPGVPERKRPGGRVHRAVP
jgi:hypothetical protein